MPLTRASWSHPSLQRLHVKWQLAYSSKLQIFKYGWYLEMRIWPTLDIFNTARSSKGIPPVYSLNAPSTRSLCLIWISCPGIFPVLLPKLTCTCAKAGLCFVFLCFPVHMWSSVSRPREDLHSPTLCCRAGSIIVTVFYMYQPWSLRGIKSNTPDW